ncbi:MAG TPA: hypothetical protein VEI74_07735 [Candidatus Methylomirabilis sp.]|nr:hypothetical protein [Candidatus Methylomirabilis sp.]
MTSHRLIKPFLAVIAALGFALAPPAFAALNADAHKEIRTAAQHAEFAVKGKNIDVVHMHLHHVINCVVGTDGAGFDAAAGDPCKNLGKGALRDASGFDGTEALLNQSLRLANIGVEINDRQAAQAVAVAARDLLQLAEQDKMADPK